jgi:hypothetical protein
MRNGSLAKSIWLLLCSIASTLNPSEMMRALHEAEDGVCLMAVPVQVDRRRRIRRH